MGQADTLRLGDWNAVCFQCGFKRKGSYLVRNWQGYYVCPEHNEPRQAQDFVRGVSDSVAPPWTQSRPTNVLTYTAKYIGLGDGVNKVFQLGDGLYATTVTAAFVSGIAVGYTVDGFGKITLTLPATKFAQVTATGSEIVP